MHIVGFGQVNWRYDSGVSMVLRVTLQSGALRLHWSKAVPVVAIMELFGDLITLLQ